MLVAIIDTGIQPGIFPTGPIMYDLEVAYLGIVRERKGKIHSFHGTLVAAILEKYAPGCEICSIKIFDDETQTTACSKLCSALRWCQSARIPIINICAGTVDQKSFKKVGRIVDKLHENGQTIIAAYNKNNIPTMPAGHKAVIGVKTDPSLLEGEYVTDPVAKKQDYIASSQHQLHFVWGKSFTTPLSTSCAVPRITAAFVNMANKNMRME